MLHSITQKIAKDLNKEIDSILFPSGLFYRIFYRSKNEESIKRKISTKGYVENGKKLQDLIGVRVALYFADDLELVKSILKKKLNFVDETIDKPEEDEFKPTRVNLVFKFSTNHAEELSSITNNSQIDDTYELQLRTVLSEGWHEVEHDLRYKCKDEWTNQLDLSRTLNGVFATLETCDWSILQIFEDLSYRHYKTGNWQAMLRNKFRLRFQQEPLSEELKGILNAKTEITKTILRTNRRKLLNELLNSEIRVPIIFSNIVFFINYLYIKEEEITKLTPTPFLEELQQKIST